jgi:hypothetical protein
LFWFLQPASEAKIDQGYCTVLFVRKTKKRERHKTSNFRYFYKTGFPPVPKCHIFNLWVSLRFSNL